MMEAARTSETSVDNYFTRQYIPEDNSELHTRRRENLKSHDVKIARKVMWIANTKLGNLCKSPRFLARSCFGAREAVLPGFLHESFAVRSLKTGTSSNRNSRELATPSGSPVISLRKRGLQ
jgi:hypothetical protein